MVKKLYDKVGGDLIKLLHIFSSNVGKKHKFASEYSSMHIRKPDKQKLRRYEKWFLQNYLGWKSDIVFNPTFSS